MKRNLLGIRHVDPEDIQYLIDQAADYKKQIVKGKSVESMGGHVIGMLFFENSTRTRVSFEQAANYLGLRTASFAAQASSMSKGETLKDTILTLRYERLSGLVMRHHQSGAPTLASRFFGGPVLNAGDGSHEHPTQALADALTITERKGGLNGLVVAIIGDVDHSRVARSNAWLLSKMGAEVRFVGPRTLMPRHTGMLPGRVFYDLESGIADADVLMCLRLQRERMDSGLLTSTNEYAKLYQINRETVRLAKKDCLVMHPGPINRGIELDDVAADAQFSAISNQVENGIFVRMAAFRWCFGEDEAPAKSGKGKGKQ